MDCKYLTSYSLHINCTPSSLLHISKDLCFETFKSEFQYTRELEKTSLKYLDRKREDLENKGDKEKAGLLIHIKASKGRLQNYSTTQLY